MKYEQLSQVYKDDVVAEALYAREIEYFHYEFDKHNFENILKKELPLEYKEQIKLRLQSTEKQMGEVTLIYEALRNQIRNEEAHKEAIKRATLKRSLI